VLPNYLEFPVTDVEIQELIAECDPNGTGNIAFRDFARLYNAWLNLWFNYNNNT